jgi:hypothetical protein
LGKSLHPYLLFFSVRRAASSKQNGEHLFFGLSMRFNLFPYMDESFIFFSYFLRFLFLLL